MEWVLIIIIGLVAGTFGSLLGLGGGIIVVPALLLLSNYVTIVAGITPQVVVGTSLLIVIVTGLSSTLAYVKQKKVDYKSGLTFFIGSGPGALFGVWLNKGIEANAFLVYFGLFMIVVSFILLIRKYLKPLKLRKGSVRRSYQNELGETGEYGYQPAVAIAISFIVGTFSGLFGIGGGSLMVPAMILLFGFPTHLAVATSMFIIFMSAIVSSTLHISLGNVDWLLALALVPGAWFGGKLGAAINQRLKSDTIVTLFRVFLIIIGLRLIWQSLTGG